MLTTEEVAAILGVNENRVRQLCRAGKLPGASRQPGYHGSWFVPWDGLQAFRELRDRINAERAGRQGRPYRV